jgi:hypothetical protein
MLHLSLLKFIKVDGVLGLYWEFFLGICFRNLLYFVGAVF